MSDEFIRPLKNGENQLKERLCQYVNMPIWQPETYLRRFDNKTLEDYDEEFEFPDLSIQLNNFINDHKCDNVRLVVLDKDYTNWQIKNPKLSERDYMRTVNNIKAREKFMSNCGSSTLHFAFFPFEILSATDKLSHRDLFIDKSYREVISSKVAAHLPETDQDDVIVMNSLIPIATLNSYLPTFSRITDNILTNGYCLDTETDDFVFSDDELKPYQSEDGFFRYYYALPLVIVCNYKYLVSKMKAEAYLQRYRMIPKGITLDLVHIKNPIFKKVQPLSDYAVSQDEIQYLFNEVKRWKKDYIKKSVSKRYRIPAPI